MPKYSEESGALTGGDNIGSTNALKAAGLDIPVSPKVLETAGDLHKPAVLEERARQIELQRAQSKMSR